MDPPHMRYPVERNQLHQDNRIFASQYTVQSDHSPTLNLSSQPGFTRSAPKDDSPIPGYATPVVAIGDTHRPTPMNPRSYTTARLRNRDWELWPEVCLRIRDVPYSFTNIRDIYEMFTQHGNVRYIKVESQELGQALVTFSPPPKTAFWGFHPRFRIQTKHGLVTPRFDLLPPKPDQKLTSTVTPQRLFPQPLTLEAASLDFGLRRDDRSMITMQTMVSSEELPILLTLDLASEKAKRMDIRFHANVDGSPRPFRLQVPITSILQILRVKQENGDFPMQLVISVKDPPRYFRRIPFRQAMKTQGSTDEWREWPLMWERQTDIDKNMKLRDQLPVSLVRAVPAVDTGRWLTYRLIIGASKRNNVFYDHFCQALDNHNVHIKDVTNVVIEPRMIPTDDMLHLDFEVRYQLEVCISHHNLNEFNMTKEFIRRLSALDKSTAQLLLENVAASNKTYNLPIEIFSARELQFFRRRRVPEGCVLMHSLTVTPTTVHLNSPTVEISNRVVRDYKSHVDRFLRVKFEDEDCYGKIWWSSRNDNQEEVYNRIRRTFKNGLDIAGRHYEFLASGSSQFRENGAYFFASTPQLKAADIRASLGKFDPINIVAKYAARIGQCFSTTRAITHVRNVNVREIPDIHHNNFCFTDGVGKISPFVAQMIADQFRINSTPGDYPSVFQFRMGGCKGILAVDPSLKGVAVRIRPSQKKFETTSEGLEIIKVSSFSNALLNQQIILVLTSLGVSNKVFMDKMITALQNVDASMTDGSVALQLLQKGVDVNQTTLAMASMILDGFMTVQEPFLMSLLRLWRAWNIKYLKEKAHIMVEESAFVFGCVDETDSLKMVPGQLPEIFVQIPSSDKKGHYKTVTGVCIIARNPSLHPGDIRVVLAVECEKLCHLKNALVLPQRGERDLANMCSGGDLDGDEYIVIWDKALIPPRDQRSHPPMDYMPPIPRMRAGKVTVEDINAFFIEHIKNDNLGTIAVHHRAFADAFEEKGGVKTEKCRRLAQLHSQAVDFPKTGVPAILDADLVPQKKPHWMIKSSPKHRYKSTGILGRLFDLVERVDFDPLYEQPFDQRILAAYSLEEGIIKMARTLKDDYDRDMHRIMAQHGIKTEFEVWTAFVMEHTREKNDYQFAEEMGRLASALKHHYRDVCLETAGLSKHERDVAKLGPLVAAMYTVTASEVAHVNESSVLISGLKPSINRDDQKPLISFPWIFAAELGQVATKGTVGKSHPAAAEPETINKQLRIQQNLRGRYAAELDGLMPTPLPEVKFLDAELSIPNPIDDRERVAVQATMEDSFSKLLLSPSAAVHVETSAAEVQSHTGFRFAAPSLPTEPLATGELGQGLRAQVASLDVGIPAVVVQSHTAEGATIPSSPHELISFSKFHEALPDPGAVTIKQTPSAASQPLATYGTNSSSYPNEPISLAKLRQTLAPISTIDDDSAVVDGNELHGSALGDQADPGVDEPSSASESTDATVSLGSPISSCAEETIITKDVRGRIDPPVMAPSTTKLMDGKKENIGMDDGKEQKSAKMIWDQFVMMQEF
ncbi:hypothetical protein MBLNU459_g2426t1 [Dothideomycetes sp. NU459]